MSDLKIYNEHHKLSKNEKADIAEFLHTHLEQFGDSKEDIEKAIDYSLKEYKSFGGFVLAYYDNSELLGAVVINQTGMNGYIPENILVYIATHNKHRGKGIGKKLMQEAINLSYGNIALHVEPDNPAKFLYEKIGFTSKYLEMRLIKNTN
ncbi:MAG: GNAT family N-acetyltransferase [Rikenellaceae bacterium]